MFAGIVSRAMTLEVLSTGVAGNYNGALQVVQYIIYKHFVVQQYNATLISAATFHLHVFVHLSFFNHLILTLFFLDEC